jgi:hypothetical protein
MFGLGSTPRWNAKIHGVPLAAQPGNPLIRRTRIFAMRESLFSRALSGCDNSNPKASQNAGPFAHPTVFRDTSVFWNGTLKP